MLITHLIVLIIILMYKCTTYIKDLTSTNITKVVK